MKLFSGSANKPLAQSIAQALGHELSPLEIFIFPDGERRIRLLEKVVDEDAVIVQPTSTPGDVNYMELFFIANALQKGGIRSINAVIPYLGYQRQDHVFREGEAVSLEVIVKTLESVGIDRVIAIDLHSIKIPEGFHIPVSHLSALTLFSEVIKKRQWNTSDFVLVSPDSGGIRRIKLIAEMLGMPYVVIEKERDLAGGTVEAVGLQGELRKRAIIVDDMISSGGTLIKAAALLKKNGVEDIVVFATHPIFSNDAAKNLQNSEISQVFVTDSVFIPEDKRFAKLQILSIGEMVAKELQKININQ